MGLDLWKFDERTLRKSTKDLPNSILKEQAEIQRMDHERNSYKPPADEAGHYTAPDCQPPSARGILPYILQASGSDSFLYACNTPSFSPPAIQCIGG